MLDYFAHVDALEPALALVCQLLRQNENIGAVLKNGHTTFLGLAQPYQELRSRGDRDFVLAQRKIASRSNYRRHSSSTSRSAARREERKNPYKRGFC